MTNIYGLLVYLVEKSEYIKLVISIEYSLAILKANLRIV